VRPVGLLDASVLYSATMRSVLLYLAVGGCFRARWSAAIQDEWSRTLLRDRPDLDPERVARTRGLMDAHIPDAVISGYEHLIGTVALPDADDRHVLAAAIHGGASLIVTANVKDFPAEALAPYKIAAQEPDAFVRSLIETDAEQALAALAADRGRLRNPAMSREEYIASLERAGLMESAAALRLLPDAL